jgi:hypothetical protein
MKASNLKSFALGFGIAIAALGLYALAATLTTFNPGDVVSSSKINDNFTNLNADVATLNTKVSETAAKVTDAPGFNKAFVFPSNSNGGNVSIPTTGGAITNVTLDAPAAGFVVVTVNLQFVATHTIGTGDEAVFKLSKTAGDVDFATDPVAMARVPAANPTTAFREITMPITLTNTFSVTKGTNTIHINAVGNRAGLLMSEVSLNAVYMPTRYGTGSAVN